MSRLWLLVLAACGRIGFGSTGADGSGGDGKDGATIAIADGSRPDIIFSTNVAFVTGSNVTPGALGGLGGADATCQTAANDAALPGTYIAWLSVTGTNAIDRLAGSRGWVRPDGIAFADQPSDIAAGMIWSPLTIAADGSDQGFGNILVTTGTTAPGAAAMTCADWTSTSATGTAGVLSSNAATWTESSASTLACAGPSRIYCFGIGNAVPVTPPTITGRRAFFSASISSGGGVEAFDAKCQAQADAAGLGGTFRAFVATEGATAISRFDTAGPRWERLDGVPLAPSAADLGTGLRVPLNTYSNGTYYDSPFGIAKAWTGATDPSSVGGLTSCASWTSTSPSSDAIYGRPNASGTTAFDDGRARRCDENGYGVYCLEL